jgi:hypothetical protein
LSEFGINDGTEASALKMAGVVGQTLVLEDDRGTWRYHINRVLGDRSINGPVFLATDVDSSATCVIKVLLPFSTNHLFLEFSDEASKST